MICAIFGMWCDQVDAYYYPNINDLTVHEVALDVGSVEGCREAIQRMAANYNDPALERGDYECGIGPKEAYGSGIMVYKETVK